MDLIGPYTVKTQRLDTKGVPITLNLTAMTFIDPSTGWFEIAEVKGRRRKSSKLEIAKQKKNFIIFAKKSVIIKVLKDFLNVYQIGIMPPSLYMITTTIIGCAPISKIKDIRIYKSVVVGNDLAQLPQD